MPSRIEAGARGATRASVIALAVALAVGGSHAASAHTGHGATASFLDGVLHPLTGADHLVAMVCVGLWAALAGGRRIWSWPVAFVVAMLVGGLLGRSGFALPAVEPAIAASVIVLGLGVASGLVVPLLPGAALIALFAVFHGFAHGAEAPADGWAAYVAGFASSTALLHLAGIAIGIGLASVASRLPARTLGLAAASLGVVLALK